MVQSHPWEDMLFVVIKNSSTPNRSLSYYITLHSLQFDYCNIVYELLLNYCYDYWLNVYYFVPNGSDYMNDYISHVNGHHLMNHMVLELSS